MSAEASGNHLAPMLMRSQTPGHNEKVLDYLEGMSRDEVDSKPPRSLLDHTEYRSQGSRSRGPSRVQSPASKRSDAGNDANGKEDDGEDYDSTTQERSENGDEAEILHVPGPKDPRGPRHESYDSGPSFGNLGPLPDESAFDPHWGNHKPTPDFAALGGKAVSPKHSSFHFDVETPSGKGSPNHFAPSVGPQSPKTVPNSPKSSGRAPTADAYRPLSPQSNQSRKTRNSERPYHQPLPESHIGEHDMPLSPVSPIRSVAPSRKAASHVSVSPSDSLSQYHVRSSKKSKANGSTAQEEASQARAPTQNGKSASHHSRPFSPYRHAPTTEDLLYAVVRDRVVPIEEQPSQELSKAPSTIKPARSEHPVPSVVSMAKSHSSSPSKAPKAASAVSSQRTAKKKDVDATPTPTRPGTPGDAKVDDDDEFVRQVLASAGTPRTSKSYTGSVLGSDIVNSHFHDNDLCVLFQFLNDDRSPDQVKKVLRKAIRRRVKDLGMKYDNESIREIQKSHQHQGFGGTEIGDMEEPPKWASDLKREIVLMQQRIESLGPKIENLRPGGAYQDEGDRFIDVDDDDDYTHTPVTQTVNIHTQATGTLAESAFQPETEIIVEEEDDGHGNLPEQAFEEVTETGPARRFPHLNGDLSQEYDRDDSPGQQYLEEELYKLRQKPASQSGRSHHSWELAQNDEAYEDEENQRAIAPTIPGSEAGYENAPVASASNHSLATIPQPNYGEDSGPRDGLLPWQRIHQRLLSWAIVWPMSEFDDALSSTMRGRQVNEVAMSIWSTQTYKRYVRSRLTDNPKQPVDRLFVPPNMADAINNAVFNGRHGDACGMLRDLWAPFGLPGMPRLLVVLAKHRSDENHWVVHRFSLPEGLLTTYDSYPEKTLPDGRPLGWWFAIRVAWPTALYPNPDHLIQKMVRLHRPMQRSVDNSLAAGGIWRNVLMGSRPERSLDLERLRDLINTEVKNLRQRKQVGKLSISAPQPTWEDMNMN